MTSFFSAAQVAAEIRKLPQVVTRVAAKLGIGTRVSGVWVFTLDEKAALVARIQKKPGRQKANGGNGLGKPPKKLSRK